MIKRYNFEVASQFKITDQIVYVEARPSKNGKYVRYSDYLKLKEAAKGLLVIHTRHKGLTVYSEQDYRDIWSERVDALAVLVGEEWK